VTSLEKMQGLGPKSAAMLMALGIHSSEQLRSLDAYEVYAQLKAQHTNVSLNFLYAILGAQEEKHWQDIQRERKMEIVLKLNEMGLL
jgi:DNA transformation protein